MNLARPEEIAAKARVQGAAAGRVDSREQQVDDLLDDVALGALAPAQRRLGQLADAPQEALPAVVPAVPAGLILKCIECAEASLSTTERGPISTQRESERERERGRNTRTHLLGNVIALCSN